MRTLDEVLDHYQRARVRARRTSTFRLRRQERRLSATAWRRRLTKTEIARLAAVRTELRNRGAAVAWWWWQPTGRRGRRVTRRRPA